MNPKIVTNVIPNSPLIEELYSAVAALDELKDLFLSSDPGFNLSCFHQQAKHLSQHISSYYGPIDTKEIDKILSNSSAPFVPVTMSSYRVTNGNVLDLPAPNPAFEPAQYIQAGEIQVKQREYPVVSSVQFSFVDNIPQLRELVARIQNVDESEGEVGVGLIEHPYPRRLCAIMFALRDCEYLLDIAFLPDVIKEISPIFSNPKITKVFHNASITCQILHEYGVPLIVNAFCLTTAALMLGQKPDLEDLTLEYRHRLGEGWISTSSKPVVSPAISLTRNLDTLAHIVSDISANAMNDWRARPISLAQMRIARQQVHYLLYLYDSLRLYLKTANESLYPSVCRISQHKASINWNSFHRVLHAPNITILSSLFQQPLPQSQLYKLLVEDRKTHSGNQPVEYVLSNATLLWIALEVPSTAQELINCIRQANPPPPMAFSKSSSYVPDSLQRAILAHTCLATKPERKSEMKKKSMTIDDIITELGWVPGPDQASAPPTQPTDFQLETTISPRVAKAAVIPTSPAAIPPLRHLRDPDQPTAVSRQIEDIPKTEASIFSLANNVRQLQKLWGKPKPKQHSVKEDVIIEESPEEVLQNLVSIGYIEANDSRQIRSKFNVTKQTKVGGNKRSRSSESRPAPGKRPQAPKRGGGRP